MEKRLATTVVGASFGATQGMWAEWSNPRKKKHWPEDKRKRCQLPVERNHCRGGSLKRKEANLRVSFTYHDTYDH